MASSSLPSLHLHSPFLLSRSHASFLIARTRWTRRPLGFPRGRGTSLAATLGPEDFSDLHAAPELFRRMEGWLYTLADAALTANSSPDVAGTLVEEGQKQGRDWLSGITDSMEAVLKVSGFRLLVLYPNSPFLSFSKKAKKHNHFACVS